MSLWNDFTKTLTGVIGKVTGISGAVKTAENVVKTLAPVVEPVVKPIAKQIAKSASGVAQGIAATGYVPGGGPGSVVAKAGTQIGTAKVIAASGADLTASAQNAMTDIVTSKTLEQVNQTDPLLTVAAAAEEKVFSPLIKRPIATAALIADPSSVLYDAGKFGEGLQPSDIVNAYNRTETVSVGQALSKAVINPAIHLVGLSDTVKGYGLDLDKANLWDDKSIQENFVDNALGRYMSGLTDTIVGNVAIQAGVSGTLGALRAGARAAGFTNKLKLTDVEALIGLDELGTQHIAGVQKSAFGADLDRAAASKDIIEIQDIVSQYSNNPRLAKLVRDTEDPSVVKDFILADNAYGPAIERLTNLKLRDDLWILGDAGAEMSADFIRTNQYRTYTIEQRQRIAGAFDDAIAKEPKHQEIYDAFFRDETIIGPITPDMAARGIEPGQIDSVPRVMGKNYVPMEPVVGKDLYIKGRETLSKVRVGTVTRDYSNVGQMTQRIIGRNGVATALIKFTTTKMPRGVVTNSGIRPGDAIEEINAHFDDIPVFKKGATLIKTSPNDTITAAQYRKNFIDRYVSARTDGERGLILDDLNKKLVVDVARTIGVSDVKAVEKIIDEAMQNVRKYHNDLANSFAMDPSNVRVVTDPETQRQLRNATALLPVGDIERFLRSSVMTQTGDAVRTAFEIGNKAFSLTQLVRPSYIGKNSLIEPMLVSQLSLGSKAITDATPTYVKRVVSDNTNKVMSRIKKAKNLTNPQRTKLANDFKNLSDQYNGAIELLDEVAAEWIEFFRTPAGRSPAAQAEYGEIIKRELLAAERQVRAIEEQLRIAAPEFTKDVFNDIPSLYNLTRRVEFLKANAPEKLAALRKETPSGIKNNQKRVEAFVKAQANPIASVDNAIASAAAKINQFAPDLEDLSNAIATQYKELEDLVKASGPLQKELESLYSIAEGKVVKSTKQGTFTVVMPNGEKLDIPDFGNKQYLGSGYEAEIANTHTRQIEITGDRIFGAKVNKFNRRGPSDVTPVTSPLYFDELSYVVNNYMRGDILVDRILAGESRESLVKNWAGTRQAASYAAEFGKSAQDIVAIIDNQISYVNRYLPTVEAQAAAAQGEVTGQTLRRLLADNPEVLTPIHPMDVTYALPVSQQKNFFETIDRLTTAAWVKLATPENKIRYAWASTAYKEIATAKVEALYAQGYEVTASMVNGIRQAAAAEVVKELEKTFYSVRRANRALFTARTVLAFPTASASGVYRYTRLAVKNPARASVFLNDYYALYNTFGVDANGNPVEDPRDAKFFIVPGTKEMGINNGQGLKFPKTSTMFMVNFAGPAYTVPLALGTVYNAWRGSDKVVKDVVNKTIGKLPGYSYDELFPYGINTNVASQAAQTVQPAWWKNAAKYLWGEEGMADFRNTMLSEYKYQMIQYYAGLGPEPTQKSILNATKKKYGIKAAWQFASIVGSAPDVNMQPGAIFQNVFNAKADEFLAMKNDDGSQKYTREEAAQKAEDFLNTKMNLPKGTVPRQLLTQGITSKRFYAPASQETVSRIWDDHTGLFDELYAMDKSLPALMTADLPLGTDPQVRKFISDPNRTLPGGDTLVSEIKSITQLKNELEVSQFWKAYIDLKDDYNKAAKKAGYASYRSVPELVDSLKEYATSLGKASKAFAISWDKSESGDSAALWTDGLIAALNNKKYQDSIGKGSQFWEHARAFIEYRTSYAEAYANAPTGSKQYVQSAWNDYLDSSLKQWDPAMQRLISKYFSNDKLKQVKFTLNTEKSK